MNILSILNTREQALLIWICVALGWMLYRKDTRRNLSKVLDSFFQRKILQVFVFLFLYVGGMIFLLSHIDFWRVNQLKDTIIWLIGTAIILLFTVDRDVDKKHYFFNLYFDNLKVLTVIGFIVNFYTLPLLVEFFLVPLLFILTVLSVVAGTKAEYKITKRFFDGLLSGIGILIVVYAFINVLTNFDKLATMNNVNTFYLPPLLTLCYLPFLYLIALYMQYESFFVRNKVLIGRNPELAKYINKRTLLLNKLNLGKLRRFIQENSKKITRTKTREEVDQVFNDFISRKK